MNNVGKALLGYSGKRSVGLRNSSADLLGDLHYQLPELGGGNPRPPRTVRIPTRRIKGFAGLPRSLSPSNQSSTSSRLALRSNSLRRASFATMSNALAELSPSQPSVKLVPRYNQDRGGANHGWLKTLHTFSFASYWDPKFESFGNLRVINEDRVEPSEGFGTHPHREMEIFSYIVSGELEHKDSMGNIETLKRGDIQMTSAGTGIRHSEYNGSDKQLVHFLQIWAQPTTRGLLPKYFTRHFSDDEKTDKLVTLVAPVGDPDVKEEREADGPAPIHSTVSMAASILTPGKSVDYTFPAPADGQETRRGFVHVVQTTGYNTKEAKGNRVRVNGGLELAEGDATFAWGNAGDKLEIENVGADKVEVLVFDISA